MVGGREGVWALHPGSLGGVSGQPRALGSCSLVESAGREMLKWLVASGYLKVFVQIVQHPGGW